MCAGVGVHSGSHVRLVLTPAPVDTGVVFVRSDVRGADNVIRAHATSVADTRNCTTIRNAAGVELATVEHLVSACAGLGVDNLIVEVDGPELPILDGSSAPFVQTLKNAVSCSWDASARLGIWAINSSAPLVARTAATAA